MLFGKYTLEKTWRSTVTPTTTFNSPGNFTIPYGKNVIYVTAQGAPGNSPVPGTGGNFAGYLPGTGNPSEVVWAKSDYLYYFTNPYSLGPAYGYPGVFTQPNNSYVSASTSNFAFVNSAPYYNTNGDDIAFGYGTSPGLPSNKYLEGNILFGSIPGYGIIPDAPGATSSTNSYLQYSLVRNVPAVPPTPYYNPSNPSTPGTAGPTNTVLGVSVPGGAIGHAATAIPPTLISQPDGQTYSITVPSGGYVTITML